MLEWKRMAIKSRKVTVLSTLLNVMVAVFIAWVALTADVQGTQPWLYGAVVLLSVLAIAFDWPSIRAHFLMRR